MAIKTVNAKLLSDSSTRQTAALGSSVRAVGHIDLRLEPQLAI